MALIHSLRRWTVIVDILFRALFLVVVLRALALVGAARLAKLCARVLGVVFTLTPHGLFKAREFSRAMHLGAWEGLRAWSRVEARPFEDYIVLRRILTDKENFRTWTVTEINSGPVQAMRDGRQPFIIATGQFCREAMVALFTSALRFHCVSCVTSTLPRGVRNLDIRLRLSMMLDTCVRLGVELFYASASAHSMRQLLTRLNTPGHVAIIMADAVWNRPDAYVRPFAGELAHRVDTGVATLARLGRCPVVTCVPVFLGPGRIELQWGPVIPPPPRRSKEHDVTVTNTLLDELERHIGLRPGQYVSRLAYERTWNTHDRRWESVSIPTS